MGVELRGWLISLFYIKTLIPYFLPTSLLGAQTLLPLTGLRTSQYFLVSLSTPQCPLSTPQCFSVLNILRAPKVAETEAGC